MKIVNQNKSVWYKRYAPNCIDDLILPQDIKSKLKTYVETQDIPNLGLWANTPGVGKSSSAESIIKEINGEALWINASMERGIDVLRGKIAKFASQSSFDDNIKIVVLDECLHETEEVRIGTIDNWIPMKLNELTPGIIYDCVSFNMNTGIYENDTCEIISDKTDEVFEVELDDGRTIKVTENHPFIVKENGKYISKSIADGLCDTDDIVNV